jgi:Xaa-Pro dipeptidase
VGGEVLEQRMVKSPEEIQWLREAARISGRLFEELRTLLRPDVSEIELYGHLALRQRLLGADGLSSKHGFNDRTLEHGWLVSGPNTSQVSGYWLTMTGLGPSPARPYGPTQRRIRAGDLVCYDVGTSVNGYHSDHARTFVVGRASDEQRRVWDALRAVQETAIAAAVPGRTAAEVYDAAARAATRHGIAEHFMTRAVLDFPYVGHGVGVEIDEPPLLSPRTSTVLRPGMVLAVEPKVIVPAWGGLTIEDTVLVTDGAPEVLTTASTDLGFPPDGLR